MPDQTTEDYCFAATSIGILEYYAGRMSTKCQKHLADWHNICRNQERKEPKVFGSVSYILGKFGCFDRIIKIENGNPSQDAIFTLIKSEIDADRPVVIHIRYVHCGIAYGYDDDGERFIYATDPDPKGPRETTKYSLNDFLNNYRRRDCFLTGLVLTKNGRVEHKMAMPAEAMPGLVEPGYVERRRALAAANNGQVTLAEIDDLLAGL